MHINADIPAGSSLTWTLIDATTGDNISGFENIEGTRVHLDAVDWETFGAMRVRLLFEGWIRIPCLRLSQLQQVV